MATLVHKTVRAEEPTLRSLILMPILVWCALLAGLSAQLVYAFWPGAPAKSVIILLIAALEAAAIALFNMRLLRASALVRLAAGGAFLWILIQFSLTFADYLQRPG